MNDWSSRVLILLSFADLVSDCFFIAYLFRVWFFPGEERDEYLQFSYRCFVTAGSLLIFSIIFNYIMYVRSPGAKVWSLSMKIEKASDQGGNNWWFVFPFNILCYGLFLTSLPFLPIVYILLLSFSLCMGISTRLEEDGLFKIAMSLGWGIWFKSHSSLSAASRSIISILGIPQFFLICLIAPAIIAVYRSLWFLSSLFFYFCTLSNAELLYSFHGNRDRNYYYLCTVGGMMAEDVPQLVIQVLFAVVSNVMYGKEISLVQWISFGLTFWRLWITITLKWMRGDKEVPDTISL